MGDGGDTPKLVPRLCHIVRWPDFNGYGFNLHAEKGKAGQFIGKVDEGSPAEAAGLKQGDRIVEVNGTNIGNENHQQVVGRIKAGGDETRLLVVDAETDQHYREEKKVVRGDLPEVLFLTAVRGQIETPAADPEPAAGDSGVVNAVSNDTNGDAPPSPQADESARYPPRLCHLCKWADFDGYGFNLHAEKDKPGQYIGSVDPDSPAETGGLKENDRIIEVNGENIEAQTHSVVIQKIKAGGDRTTMLVVDREADEYYKGRGITVSSTMRHVIVCTTPPRRGGLNESDLDLNGPSSVHAYGAESHRDEEQTSDSVAEAQSAGMDVSTLPEPNVSLSDEETETVTAVVAEPVESAPVPEAETVQNGTEVGVEEEAAAPVTDDVAEAVAAMAVDDVVAGEGVDVNAYEEVEIPPPTQSYDEAQGTASNGINSVAVEPEPEPEPEPTPVAAPEPTPVAKEPEPEPAVIRSTTTVSNTAPEAVDGGLNLHLSAAEMKERLRARRKQDPRLQKQSFEAKHKMFERM